MKAVRTIRSAQGKLPPAARRLAPTLPLAAVILIALLVRLGFALRPPPFLTPDSQGYFLPGWELAHGLGFGPELRRTPLYPLFISLVVFLFGDDLRGLVVVQHALGVVTAGLAYSLGRLAFGTVAGLAAGLLVALAGPLLVYEHYVLTESLFACLLSLALLLMLRSLRQPSRGRLLAAGVGLAAAALTRPVADALLPLLPLALLLSLRALRPAARAIAWFGLGFGLLFLPWMARNAVAHGSFSAEGALGQALIGRTVRHDDVQRFYPCATANPGGGDAARAVWIICDEAATARARDGGVPSGGGITERVRTELGLSQAQTSNLLRQVAGEAIARQQAYYLSGSLKKAGEILVGKRETVLLPWRERTGSNWDNKWDPRLASLVTSPPRAEGPEYERADALVSFFQPWRWRRELGLLLAVGLLAAVLRPRWRAGLLAPLAAAAIVLASAALDGDVYRYRYPVDPLLAVAVGGGLQALWLAAHWAFGRVAPRPRTAPASPEPAGRIGPLPAASGANGPDAEPRVADQGRPAERSPASLRGA